MMLMLLNRLCLVRWNVAKQLSTSAHWEYGKGSDYNFREKWNKLYRESATFPNPTKSRKPSLNESSRATTVSVLKCGPERVPSLAVRVQHQGKTGIYFFNYQGAATYYQTCNLSSKIKGPEKLFFTSGKTSDILSCFSTKIVQNKLVTVYGPKGVHHIIQAVMRYLMSSVQCEETMGKLAFNELHSDVMDIQDNQVNIKMVKVEANKMPTVAYILTLPKHFSTICEEKCKNLGIDLNRTDSDFKSLEEFMEYKSFLAKLRRSLPAIDPETEVTIHPEDVFSAPDISKLLIVDCPTPAHLGALLQNPHLSCVDDIKMVAHVVPNHISSSYQYQSWSKRFHKDCVHLWLSTHSEDFQLLVPDLHRMILNRIDPILFPCYEKIRSLQEFSDAATLFDMHSLSPYEYRVGSVVTEQEPNKDKLENFAAKTAQYMELLENIPTSDINPKEKRSYPRLVVLGSGGSVQSTVRSGPCFLIQTSVDTSILVDCADSAYTQLYRHFGANKIKNVLSTIKAIFISHRHTDHFNGLPEMLHMIKKHCPHHHVCVLLPGFIKKMVWLLTEEKGLTKHCTLIPTENLHKFDWLIKNIEKSLYLKQMLPVVVDHGVRTHGLILKGADWKIVYSADTLPMCEALIEEGIFADILIHDSLYINDSHRLETKLKRHSVCSDAIRTAHAMKAKHVLLTHFSTSHPLALPIDLNDKGKYEGSVMYAIDNMELTLDTVARFPETNQSLQIVFAEKIQKYFRQKSNSVVKRQNILNSFELANKINS